MYGLRGGKLIRQQKGLAVGPALVPSGGLGTIELTCYWIDADSL